MRSIIIIVASLLIFSMSATLVAQEQSISKSTFLRVYDSNNIKIAKGRLVEFTENTIRLKRGQKIQEINYKEIGTIKTKKSAGNNVLLGTAVGGSFVALLGSGGDDSGFVQYSSAEGAGVGFLIGAPIGATAGALSSLFKNSISFEIQGEKENFEQFKSIFVQ